MVVGWAPWWTGQTERTTLLTVGGLQKPRFRKVVVVNPLNRDILMPMAYEHHKLR
jgi:hypothetical protein